MTEPALESTERLPGRIEIEHVSMSYAVRGGDPVLALDDLVLDIAPGEIVTVLGPSGCGKTTLLNLVAGFERPTLGSVLHDGRPIDGSSPKRMVVFQHNALFPWKTVLDNVAMGPTLRGVGRAERRAAALRQIQDVGLAGFEHRYPHELSGGMQRRAEIARALINDLEVLLMDEPFGALDALTRQHMQEQLLDLWSKTRKTILFVTHDVVEAVYLSDRVLIMTDRPGRIELELAVDLPRPRDYGITTTPAFTHFVDRALVAIRREAA